MNKRHHLFVSSVVLAALLTAGTRSWARAPHDDEVKDPGPRPASDQDEALRLARKVDLPALGRADRLVIEEVRPAGGARRVDLKDAKAIRAVREALKPRKVPPSGGKTAYRLSFYRGKHLVRKVWVYDYGEWGFERPKGPHWTTGKSADLVAAIKRHLK